MAALENTLNMGKWKLLLLLIFLVPRCNSKTFAVNRTGIIFKQLDHLLTELTEKHITTYGEHRACFRSLDFIEENYDSEHYGIVLLQNILERYNNLTQLYNSGCKNQTNENLSKKDITCGPFGCHKVEIRFLPKNKIQRSVAFNTYINSSNNHMNVFLATESPTVKPTFPTAHSLTTRRPPATQRPTTILPLRADLDCSEQSSDKDRKWLPLPFHPWGYCSKIHPVATLPTKGG